MDGSKYSQHNYTNNINSSYVVSLDMLCVFTSSHLLQKGFRKILILLLIILILPNPN